jgi:hypothetical protein
LLLIGIEIFEAERVEADLERAVEGFVGIVERVIIEELEESCFAVFVDLFLALNEDLFGLFK